MINSDVEAHIRNNYVWGRLPENLKQTLGNNEKNWEKCVSEYCIKNQYRFKSSLVKRVRKDEKQYYEELIRYSRQHLMLFPYHLSDMIVKGLRLTPFAYYCNMMQDIMDSEKSYDSLPNFTAADCLRLLGIGRNQYIEMMNKCKSSKRFFRVKRPAREHMPAKPVSTLVVESWWIVHGGYITEDDVKMCSSQEKKVIDQIIDSGPAAVRDLDKEVVQGLYSKGLVYFEVPIVDSDIIAVPPLENFVMNRVLGDYMETMLYKVFVSIDEHTTVAELAQVLEIDIQLVKNAVSLFCRLGLAQKKTPTDNSSSTSNPSSPFISLPHTSIRNFLENESDVLISLDPVTNDVIEQPAWSALNHSDSSSDLYAEENASNVAPGELSAPGKRIAFLFDSTLTAFLMMGNLSQGLKRHAVTMFEVGKLSDETMDNFVAELGKVESMDEGEARRYFEHAVILKDTIQYLRHNSGLSFEQSAPCGLDLVRCESMNSLDPNVCARILMKKYCLLISMAPLSNEIRPLSSCKPPHIGPALPEVNSVWFKLFLYSKVKQGPTSLLLVKGTRLRRLPTFLQRHERLLITTWGHDPAVVASSNVLYLLNDALSHSPVLIQVHGIYTDGEIEHVSFPLDDKYLDAESQASCPYASVLQAVSAEFDLSSTCGYVTLVNIASRHPSRRSMPNMVSLGLSRTAFDGAKDRLVADVNNEPMDCPDESDDVLQRSTNTSDDASDSTSGFEKVDMMSASEDGHSVSAAADNRPDPDAGDDVVTIGRACVDVDRPPTWPVAVERQMSREVSVRDAAPDAPLWLPLQVVYGLPLFEASLNKEVCSKLVSRNICSPASLTKMADSNRSLALELLDFIQSWQNATTLLDFNNSDRPIIHPSQSLIFENGAISLWRGR